MKYISLEHNQIDSTNMTDLELIFPEKHNSHILDNKCNHCNNQISNKQTKKETVLSRGLYADKLEPEYHRYNKSIKIDIDEMGRKYLQYKPRRPKCPIVFNQLFPHGTNKPYLIHNPLYSYPINSDIRNSEKKWFSQLETGNKNMVKNIRYMMDEYDSAYIN